VPIEEEPMSDLRTRMDEATAPTRLLDHPFYKAWSAGTLTREDLGFYSTQYWRQVESFPSRLEELAGRVDGDARAIVTENLRDERDDDHPGLWLRFAEAVGANASDVEAAAVETETAECIESFRTGINERSEAFALGMLYAYESQTPAVAKTKVEGLRSHYGIDGEAVAYFELHGELDIEHTEGLVAALEQVATTPDAEADAVAGARAGAEAVWKILDGVARVREIC
jgi:pyrroloquinoline-quinone synthase